MFMSFKRDIKYFKGFYTLKNVQLFAKVPFDNIPNMKLTTKNVTWLTYEFPFKVGTEWFVVVFNSIMLDYRCPYQS